MTYRGNLTTLECWRKLEELDAALEAAKDNRSWRGLMESRKWWAAQLVRAQLREGYPQY